MRSNNTSDNLDRLLESIHPAVKGKQVSLTIQHKDRIEKILAEAVTIEITDEEAKYIPPIGSKHVRYYPGMLRNTKASIAHRRSLGVPDYKPTSNQPVTKLRRFLRFFKWW